MPGPDYAGIVTFYEDFPYAWWNDFRRLEDLGADPLAGLPADVSINPEFADITDQIERKITGISLYESQIERLFDGTLEMAERGPRLRPGDGGAGRRGRFGRTVLGVRSRLSR